MRESSHRLSQVDHMNAICVTKIITLGGQYGWISAEAIAQPFEQRVDKNEVLPFRETLLMPA